MKEVRHKLTRRAVLASAIGGGVVATAIAGPRVPRPLMRSLARFDQAFTSPFLSLALADHVAWRAETGKQLQVRNGAILQVTGVETFVAYGARNRALSRSRAFVVNFQVLNGVSIAPESVHSVTHPRHGTFDLFLIATPELPAFVQAVFN